MLQAPSPKVQRCQQRAAEAHERAVHATGPLQHDYLDIEQRWLRLAKSYEFAAQIERYFASMKRHTKPPC